MNDKTLAVRFYQDENGQERFTLDGAVSPEKLEWERNGKQIETTYLYENAHRGEGQLASFATKSEDGKAVNVPVFIKLKMTLVNQKQDGKTNKETIGLAEAISKYQF